VPLSIPKLDDRSFDDLVAEAKSRLATHTPELRNLVPGDPGAAFIDLFAWLAETILYRANLIPERQRRAFLNLLQLPLQRARPGRGIVSLDATALSLPAIVPAGTGLSGGGVSLTTEGEILPTPLELHVLGKQPVTTAELAEAGITLAQLRQQYGLAASTTLSPFRPVVVDTSPLTLSWTQDQALYLALTVPKKLVGAAGAAKAAKSVRENLAGETLCLGVAPPSFEPVEMEAARTLPARTLAFHTAYFEAAANGGKGAVRYLPLEIVDDSSRGGRETGVVRLRLPGNTNFLTPPPQDDPQFAGWQGGPPELPADVDSGALVLWLRLTCPSDPALRLGYLGHNAVEVVAQKQVRDQMLGVGTGEADQSLRLPDTDVDPDALVLEVETPDAWETWARVEHFGGQGPDDKVYVLDDEAGLVRFGDGVRGLRLPERRRVRAALYRAGGGAETNLPADTIKEVSGALKDVKVRHAWPLTGGADRETAAAAERRIPAFLTHRGRAITREDFAALARETPTVQLARADAVSGLIPSFGPLKLRRDVPGAVSVFVLPPGERGVARAPRATRGLLEDVFRYLRDRTLIGTELYVLAPEYKKLAISVKVTVADARVEHRTLAAVEQAIVDFLWPLPIAGDGGKADGWPLGGTVDPEEIETQVARVAGVRSVGAIAFFVPAGSSFSRLAAGATLTLEDYQLPDLVGVSAQTGTGTPSLPPGITSGTDSGGAGGGVSVPVVPELC
jgi:hypothetical protein